VPVILVRTGSGGSGLSLRSDDLDSVVELYSENDLRQQGIAFEATPSLIGSLREFEDHRERGLVGEAAFRSGRSMANGRKRALNRVRGPQVPPVLSGKVVEREQASRGVRMEHLPRKRAQSSAAPQTQLWAELRPLAEVEAAGDPA
jgi:hypothetical protein